MSRHTADEKWVSGSHVIAASPPPTIVAEGVVATQKKNAKGKPVGKPVFGGFFIKFSEPMNPVTAGAQADYRVLAKVVKTVKNSTVTSFQPVAFSVSYSPASDTATIRLGSTKPFANGGQIVVAGVTSQYGTALSSSDTTSTILAQAKGITLGCTRPGRRARNVVRTMAAGQVGNGQRKGDRYWSTREINHRSFLIDALPIILITLIRLLRTEDGRAPRAPLIGTGGNCSSREL